ncbi:MAG TPA: hypothetical protein VJS92_00605, partial [Candidatus Polarisedimenticolaceae bacterium]|nr:hypothetical protein [Candidatus Polarisedimenticolaceae bacterium]
LEQRLRSALGSAMPAAPAAESAEPPKDPLEAVLDDAPAEPAILSPHAGTRAGRSRIDVEVLYPSDLDPQLTVNGRIVPDARIGTRSVLPIRKLAAARYVGVELDPGAVTLEFRAVPPGTDPRAVEPVRVTLVRPDAPVELRLGVPEGGWVADGSTSGTLIVEALDRTGVRSFSNELVTLESAGAAVLSADASPAQDGVQLRLDDGRALVRFAPLALPARVLVTATTETMRAETFVDVRPAGGSWRVLGLVEGRLAGDAGVEGDGGVGPGLDDGVSESGGRLAAFAQGPLGGDSRVTVSLDTDRERDLDRLTHVFEPDRFYPVPGDSSTPVDTAPAQGALFARIDGPRGYAQWGDFSAGFPQAELTRYGRALSGASGRVASGPLAFEGFAASSDQLLVRDLFEPDGTSGPFLLRRHPVVARSETVIVEVRERFRTEEILSRRTLRRDLDYSLDPEAGTILLRAPLQAFDAELNPLRVVVLYEARAGGPQQLTGGGRIAYRPSERIEIGASTIAEERQGEDLALYGLDLSLRPAAGTTLRAELAASHEQTSATAVRFELLSRPRPELDWSLSYRDLPADFVNPGLLAAPEVGSRRYGGRLNWQPDAGWRVRAEAFSQDDERSDVEREVAGADVERVLGPVTLLGGLKHVSTSGGALGEDASSSLVRTGARARFGRFTAELTHDELLGEEVAPGYPERTGVGLGYQVTPDVRAYLRQEFEAGGEGTPERDRTVIGIEGQAGSHVKALSQYTLEQGASGEALRALTGLETSWPLSPQLSLRFSADRLATSRGDESIDYTSVAGGYEYLAGASRLSGRYELRLGERDRRHLLGTYGAFRAREAWTLFISQNLFRTEGVEALPTAWRAEGLYGVAFRPLASPWQFLLRLDHQLGAGNTLQPGAVPSGGVTSEPSSSLAVTPRDPADPGLGTGIGRSFFERDASSLSFALGARVAPHQRLAATFVVRCVEADHAAALPATRTHLVSLHWTAQVAPRWTVGTSLRQFAQDAADSESYGVGTEVGYLAFKNLWLLGGYNVAGFSDMNFPGAEHSERGPFAGLRFKFDETSVRSWSDLRLDRP